MNRLDQGRRSHRIIGGDIKEDWGSSPPVGSSGGAPVGGLAVPQKLKLFCETTHKLNSCIKIQQTTVAVTRVDILNGITSKILGGTLPWMFPFINIGGTCPPVP